ncbi:MAG: EamA family transporter [Actinobacteria bacterium]|nr:EamA family transporter [Actinomycetota bacterium]
MPVSALALALGSAVLHAVWNLLLGRARDVQAATAATFVLSFAIAVPFAVIWWHAEPSVWPYALASSVLEIVYVIALALAYRQGEVSFVYPVTRGLAPVLALGFAILWLGHRISAAEVAGVLLVGAGVVLVRGVGGGDRLALLLAATLAVTIAAYTLVDRVGIGRAGALTYFLLTLAGPCLVYPPLVGTRAMRREVGGAVLAAALANLGSFMLGLLALRHAGAAVVLAVRWTSVVLTTALAGRVLAERVSRGRLAGSALVLVGIGVLAR